MPANEVPNFVAMAKGKYDDAKEARAWLARYGLSIFQTWCSGQWKLEDALHWFSGINPGVPFILSGACKGDHHAVVVKDGKIAHDPSNSGIEGPCEDGNWWFDIITVADHWKAAV